VARIVILIMLLASASGCELAGVIASGIEETGSHTVFAEYHGLEGKSFAVVVDVDRSILGRWPLIAGEIATRVDADLSANTEASGHVPPADVIRYQQTNPRWHLMERAELAEALGGVDRIILIELYEFRTNEPGNRYVWDGLAAGSVAVLETDGPFPEEFAFQRPISVRFPDDSGRGPNDFSALQVASVLVQRFSQRVSWLFYDHEEPNVITY